MWGWQQRLDAGAQEGEWIGAVREGVKKTVTNVISQKNIFCIFYFYKYCLLLLECQTLQLNFFGIENYPPPLIFIQEKLNCKHFKLICTCKRSCIRLYEMRRRSSRVADCGFASCKKENQFTLYRQLCATFQKGLYFPLGKNLANLKSGFPRCCSALSCSRCLQRNGKGGVKPEIKIYVIPFCDEESLKN